MSEYSTKRISKKLVDEIKNTLQNKAWGSVEIYVQDHEVVQITDRNIKKTLNNTGKKKNLH